MNLIPSPVRSLILLGVAWAALLAGGCATNYVKVDSLTNPAPTERFANFHRFEIKPIQMGAPYAGQEANDKALVKIQENLDLRVNSLLAAWTAAGTSKAGDGPIRTLVIEPSIKDIKFVNSTSRVWAGALAGSSAVVLKIRFVDGMTGNTVAEPEFYQRAAAMGGAWSFGATDNNMLVRIAELASKYFQANYDNAVGGPTGAVAE